MPFEPPAGLSLPVLDRRRLFKGAALGAGLGAVVMGSPVAAQALGPRGFTYGVASGEPGPRRVLLWTRYAASQDTELAFEVSESLDFANARRGGSVTARAAADFCAKAWAEDLEPGRWYYYRFIAPDGTVSETGRTRTLPEGPTARWKMAVFSCSNIGFGYFNAYAHAAEANEFDCAVHLGDYLYEYARGNYPEQAVAGREEEPASELIHLADYRARYAEYRRDPDLRRLHQLYPMIVIFDDHETANDAWQNGAENHDPATEGPWDARKKAAMQAWHEWLPVSDEPWAEYAIGDLASIFRLETRLTARAHQFNLGQILAGAGTSQAEMKAALDTFRDGVWQDPSRELLGAAQQDWLAAGFKASRGSGKTWQVLAQQVIMGKLVSSSTLADALPKDAPDYVRKRIVSGALAGAEGVPFNMDAWDGYPAARERLLRSALDADANLVTLTGDSHNAWGFDLDLGGTPAGVEFAGTSVTSPGIENYLPQIPSDRFADDTVATNPQLKWMDASRRGYMAVELTPTAATSDFRFVADVRGRSAQLTGSQRVTVLAGTRKLALA